MSNFQFSKLTKFYRRESQKFLFVTVYALIVGKSLFFTFIRNKIVSVLVKCRKTRVIPVKYTLADFGVYFN